MALYKSINLLTYKIAIFSYSCLSLHQRPVREVRVRILP